MTRVSDGLTALGRAGRHKSDKLAWDAGVQANAKVLDEVAQSGTGTRRTRIAIVCGHYAPRIGGLERYAASLARGIRDSSDLDVVVITSAPGRRRQWDVIDGVPVLRLPTLLTIANTPINPSWLWRLPLVLHRLRVDVVHAHAPVPGLADLAILASGRRRRILTYHSGSMVKNVQGWADRAIRLYEGHVLPRVFDRTDQLVAVSAVSLSSKRPRCRTIAPGVDAEFVSSRRSDMWRRAPYLLYVGRVERTSRAKGIEVLVRAYEELMLEFPDLELWIVGAGDAVPDLAAVAQRLGLHGVRLPGVLLGSDLVQAYCEAEVLILPSTTEAESFGLCLIEAMACAVPVVASNIGGPSTVVSPEVDGLLVPPGNVAELASAVRRLLRNPQMRKQLGIAGREKVVRNYLWSRQVELNLGLYRAPAFSVRRGRNIV